MRPHHDRSAGRLVSAAALHADEAVLDEVEPADPVTAAEFVELGERLEKLKERHDKGLDDSRKFLKEILRLAHDIVQAEKETPEIESEDQGKAALTELFEEVRNGSTPIIVERIVNEIDEIVRIVRFPDWQNTSAGERDVKKALRKVLLGVKLHGDQELFGRAYSYIKQYY